MHSMLESATSAGRDHRRREAAHRITVQAQELTLAHGCDGFTMDDLAVAAGVSRRTLFNYFPSKVDAVLGHFPEARPGLREEFRAGGPTGDLVTDLTVLARELARSSHVERSDVARSRAVLAREPRLLAAAHERFAVALGEYVEDIRLREGADFDPQRARLVVRVLGAVADMALDTLLESEDDLDLADHLEHLVSTARTVLAPTDR